MVQNLTSVYSGFQAYKRNAIPVKNIDNDAQKARDLLTQEILEKKALFSPVQPQPSADSLFAQALKSKFQQTVTAIAESEIASKKFVTDPHSISTQELVHKLAGAEDALKLATSITSAAIKAYQRLINIQI